MNVTHYFYSLFKAPLAFVDLETTGLGPAAHRVVEVAVVTLDEGRIEEWSSLVHPGGRLPAATRYYTGLTDEHIAEAPRFEDIAPELQRRLDGRVFVAHNARFDHGFLRSEFTRLGMPFDPQVLCTVRLSRKLYPAYTHHNLDALMERHGLAAEPRHRALPDAQLLWQFWQAIHRDFTAEHLAGAMEELLRTAPARTTPFDPAFMDSIPATHGAYALYGEDQALLHVGRAANLRQKILGELDGRSPSPRKLMLAQATRDVRWVTSAGPLGAMFEAARLAQSLQGEAEGPLLSWKLREPGESPVFELVATDEAMTQAAAYVFGAYDTERKARGALLKAAKAQGVCEALAGLGRKQGPCRACGRRGDGEVHYCTPAHGTARAGLVTALSRAQLQPWPYDGPVGIREKRQLHVIDSWCYLGTARSDDELHALLDQRSRDFDFGIYQELVKRLPGARKLVLLPQS